VSGAALKAKLAAGELAIGTWLTFADPAVAEIVARAGVDWIAVDLEHSALDVAQAQELVRVITLCGVPALVRLSSNDPVLAKRVLDGGASGIIVPMVNSAAEADAAVAAAKYPPRGRRGVGIGRAHGYGPRFADYMATADDETVVVVQIEHIDAVRQLESIVDVPGVDAILVGPYDLSASLDAPGDLDDPAVQDALARIEAVTRARGMPAGVHFVEPEPDLVAAAVEGGVRFLAYSVDFLLLGETCRRHIQAIRDTARL
jgi:2-dehydro-3-deoxyglucarate aldolase